jgi:hypothetical protein
MIVSLLEGLVSSKTRAGLRGASRAAATADVAAVATETENRAAGWRCVTELRSMFIQCRVGKPWVLALTLWSATAAAHHSPVAFNTGVTDFTLTGEIRYVDVRNPHSVMELSVVGEGGAPSVWHIEFSSVNLLLRRGWDVERLKVGDQVTCIGNPSATGKTEMYMWSIVLPDGTEFGR